MAGYGNRPGRGAGGSMSGDSIKNRALNSARTLDRQIKYFRKEGLTRDSSERHNAEVRLWEIGQEARRSGQRVNFRTRSQAATAYRDRAQRTMRETSPRRRFGGWRSDITTGTAYNGGGRIRRAVARNQGNLFTGRMNEKSYGSFRRV